MLTRRKTYRRHYKINIIFHTNGTFRRVFGRSLSLSVPESSSQLFFSFLINFLNDSVLSPSQPTRVYFRADKSANTAVGFFFFFLSFAELKKICKTVLEKKNNNKINQPTGRNHRNNNINRISGRRTKKPVQSHLRLKFYSYYRSSSFLGKKQHANTTSTRSYHTCNVYTTYLHINYISLCPPAPQLTTFRKIFMYTFDMHTDILLRTLSLTGL